jgi:hypothetical protein
VTDIPEHIVERVAAAINESARMPGYLDAPFSGKEARIFARAAIEALGGERVWIVNTAQGHRYAIEGSWRVAKHLASGFGMSHAPCSALLIPTDEEGEQ